MWIILIFCECLYAHMYTKILKILFLFSLVFSKQCLELLESSSLWNPMWSVRTQKVAEDAKTSKQVSHVPSYYIHLPMYIQY